MFASFCSRKVRLGAVHGTKTEYKGGRSTDPIFVDFKVEDITSHELYDHKTSQNDVALVRVRGEIKFNGNITIG